jgi:hypothetical protein
LPGVVESFRVYPIKMGFDDQAKMGVTFGDGFRRRLAAQDRRSLGDLELDRSVQLAHVGYRGEERQRAFHPV